MRAAVLALFLLPACATEPEFLSQAQTTTEHGVALWTDPVVSVTPYLEVTAARDGHELVYGSYRTDFELDGHVLGNPGASNTAVLAKLDVYGHVEWLRDARSPDGDYTSIADAAGTSDGGVVVVAVAFSSLDLGCGDISGRFVIARFDASGHCLWSRRAEAEDTLQFQASSLAVGPDDRVIVAGIVYGTATWDDVTLSAADIAPFVLSLDGDGTGVWGHVLPLTGGAGNPVAGIDSRGITTVAEAYIGTLEDQTADGTDYDLFVGQLDADGNMIRTASLPGNVDVNLFLDVGPTGEIAIAGRFRGTLANLVNTSTTRNTFVIKYTPDAAILWTKKLTGGAAITVAGVRVDYRGFVDLVENAHSTLGNHVIIGSFKWTASTIDNAYLARFGPLTGSTQWAVRYGDEESMVRARGLGATLTGRILLAGVYDGTPDFGEGPLPPPPDAHAISGFVARIHQ